MAVNMQLSLSNRRLFRAVAVLFLGICSTHALAQVSPAIPVTDTTTPMPSYEERAKKWGPNDTIIVGAIWYNKEMLSTKEEPMVWVSKLPPKKLEKYIAEWTRLRNAVYVTYPYARVAGYTINDINAKL